jgi:hypothetical protein
MMMAAGGQVWYSNLLVARLVSASGENVGSHHYLITGLLAIMRQFLYLKHSLRFSSTITAPAIWFLS